MNNWEENRDSPTWKTINQIQGFMEIGMHKESVKLAKRLLKSDPIDSRMFYQALEAILVGDNPKKLKALVFASYDRLKHTDKKSIQDYMLYFTNTVEEMKRAQDFVPIKSNVPITLLMAMETCLENMEFEKAKRIRSQCLQLLPKTSDEYETSLLLNALADYAETVGDHDQAEKHWLKLISLDQPSFPSAVRGLIRNKAAQARKHMEVAMAQIQKFRGCFDAGTSLKLPGNHDRLLNRAEKNLKSYRKALEKILPEKDLPKYGFR